MTAISASDRDSDTMRARVAIKMLGTRELLWHSTNAAHLEGTTRAMRRVAFRLYMWLGVVK